MKTGPFFQYQWKFLRLVVAVLGLELTVVAGTSLGFTPQGQPVVTFDPIPAAMEYQLNFSTDLAQPFAVRTDGAFGNFNWTSTPPADTTVGFYRVGARLLPPDRIAAFNLLSRITYGPTPDDLDRVAQIGPDAYLAEQLAAETIPDNTDTPVPFVEGWTKVTATGTASSSRLYLYLNDAGDLYLDDLRLVLGTSDNGTAANLLRNPNFEATLTGTWVLNPTTANSSRSAVQVHGGAASLHLIDTGLGSDKTAATSVYQDITPALNTSQQYTLSFWYYATEAGRRPIVRLSGSGIVADTVEPGSLRSKRAILDAGKASKAVLQGWHVQRAVQSPRQLNEVLRQFLENHFVTEYSKSLDFLDGRLPGNLAVAPTSQMEFRENQLWANALLNPQVTFHDLLKISAESPAMIIYLDTVVSAGAVDTAGRITKIANENYARELLELFTFGVDNGYDQQDIVQLSRAWTGWTVELTPPGQEANPLAKKSTVYVDSTIVTNKNAYTNLQGQWSFIFKSANHYTGPKYLFSVRNDNGTLATNQSKTVPARFGPPWAGRAYQLKLPARTGNTGLQDGYDVLAHLADQPFTQEFLSVKLCRLFVHDDFSVGYDFTDDQTSAEEDLVHRMMLAWENPPGGGAKGQLRPVLKVLFDSALFRSSLASAQKVKTPLEYAVSVIRALRAKDGDNGYTADTDGTSLAAASSGSSGIINKAGRMDLFNRAEPDGYPESAPGWISAGTLAERLRFVQAALIPVEQTGHTDAGTLTFTNPTRLLALKNVSTKDSQAVADYLLQILFPAEGAANLAAYRKLAIQYLDTANDGVTASPLSSVSATELDNRIRGATAALMTTARFQEQ